MARKRVSALELAKATLAEHPNQFRYIPETDEWGAYWNGYWVFGREAELDVFRAVSETSRKLASK